MIKHILTLGLGAMLLTGRPTSNEPTVIEEIVIGPSAERVVDFRLLARGPVHEALDKPLTGQASPPLAAPTEPPPTIDELSPDQQPQGSRVQWIGGYWAWNADSDTFLWVRGIWFYLSPGREWVPGYWIRRADGWQRVSGFWTQYAELRSAPCLGRPFPS